MTVRVGRSLSEQVHHTENPYGHWVMHFDLGLRDSHHHALSNILPHALRDEGRRYDRARSVDLLRVATVSSMFHWTCVSDDVEHSVTAL